MGVLVEPAPEVEINSETETSSIGPDLTVAAPVGNRLTAEAIKKILDSDRRVYYRTKELNDKLFIHYGGWKKLENLAEFTGLKVLYGECNSFDQIEGLETCTQLKSLFLNQNCIREISGLDNLVNLWSLNLSENFIQTITHLDHLVNLNTLIVANNNIGVNGLSDLNALRCLPISCLDIQNNKIDDPQVLDVLMDMPNLSVLYLKGNPVVRKIDNYRKTVIAAIPGLKFLDERPVFDEDRRCAEAFTRGGMDAERQERKDIQKEKENEHNKNMQAFDQMIAEAKSEHREGLAMRQIDRYTDENDPVESLLRVQRRWYAEHDTVQEEPDTRQYEFIPPSRNDSTCDATEGSVVALNDMDYEVFGSRHMIITNAINSHINVKYLHNLHQMPHCR